MKVKFQKLEEEREEIFEMSRLSSSYQFNPKNITFKLFLKERKECEEKI